MQLEELCEGLLDALEKWDEEILPFGLYASDEFRNAKGQRAQKLGDYQEVPRAIIPFMKAASGEGPTWEDGASLWRFGGPKQEALHVQLNTVRAANIKVRRYGSGYQVDKREHRESRWWEANLDGHLQMMLQPPDAPPGENGALIVVLIAFDKTKTPFGGAIHELNGELQPERNNIFFRTRCWMDKAKRGFGVRVAVWARSSSTSGPPST